MVATAGKEFRTACTGDSGKTRVKFTASGNNLIAPSAQGSNAYFDQQPKVTVQLVNNMRCWTADYTPTVTTNTDADSFKVQVKE